VLRYAWRAGQGESARHAELVANLATDAASLEWGTGGAINRTENLLEQPPAV
jgi:hypothetical protein